MERDSFSETVTTEAEFGDALRALLIAAHRNGVDVEGVWICPGEETTPDWETTVVRFDRAGGTE